MITQDIGVGPRRVFISEILALEMPGEVERHEARPCRPGWSPEPSTRTLPPSGPCTQTISPSRKPTVLASKGLTSTNMSCCSSASQGFERLSSPPPSYSTRRPEVRMIGKSLEKSCDWIEAYRVGRR